MHYHFSRVEVFVEQREVSECDMAKAPTAEDSLSVLVKLPCTVQYSPVTSLCNFGTITCGALSLSMQYGYSPNEEKRMQWKSGSGNHLWYGAVQHV